MNKLIFSFSLFVVLSYMLIDPAILLQDATGWATPIKLSNEIIGKTNAQADAAYPALGVDSSGKAHAFFAARIFPETSSIGDTLFYTYWNGTDWSQPVDIIYTPNNLIWKPQVAIDQEDRIHLVWLSQVNDGYLWYSTVNAKDAGLVRAWSSPEKISPKMTSTSSIAIGPDGVIHIIYSNQGKIFCMQSTADGSWSSAIELLNLGEDLLPRLAVDNSKRLHLVLGAQGSGDAVYYMKTDKSESDWTDPSVIDRRDDRYGGTYGPAWINVITNNHNEVHISWDGAPYGQRWHQWSRDGGVTWLDKDQISDNARGLTGPNAMAFDDSGRLHFFTLGVKGTPPYYAYWQNGVWSSLDPIASQYYWDGEGPDMVIAGDQIVTVWWNRSEAAIEIFSTSIKINLDSVLTHMVNTQAVKPEISPFPPSSETMPSPSVTQINLQATNAPSPLQTNQSISIPKPLPISTIIALSSLPIIIILLIIMIIRSK